MSLATVAAVVGIGAGVNSIVQSNKNKPGGGGTTDAAANAADPFGPFRAQYGQELGAQYNRLQNFDPNSVTSNPEYQFQLDQGLGAINKSAAASGMLGSGNRLMDLQKYGQGLASSFADKQYGREMSLLQMLGGFSGATTGSPGGAASAMLSGQQFAAGQQNYGLNSITSGLNGISDWWNKRPIGPGTNPNGNGTGPGWTGSGYPEGGGP